MLLEVGMRNWEYVESLSTERCLNRNRNENILYAKNQELWFDFFYSSANSVAGVDTRWYLPLEPVVSEVP